MAERTLFLSLSRVRLAVQWLMLVVTVYGGAVVGSYMAEKISQNLPALSCAYDKQNGAYCVLIPFQHQLHHRVGEALVQFQQFSFGVLLPLVFTVLLFYAFFAVLNKAFCGWICPLGTLQELLFRLGRKLRLPLNRLGEANVGRVRPVKWLMLVGLVFLLPLLAGVGVAPHAVGDAYCQVCPSRIATTLLTLDGEQLAVETGSWAALALNAVGNALFGFVIVASLAVRQPFCRICPMLALHALFRRAGLLRLVKKPHEKCGRCGICAKACPMDIHEIHREHGARAFHADCTLCGRCVEFCPDDGVIALEFGPIPVFRSSRAYYGRRIRRGKPDGDVKLRREESNG